MTYKDPEKKRDCSRRYRKKKHEEKYGPNAGSQIGKHGNHARGEKNSRWNNGQMRTSNGYIAIAVPEGHHLRQAHGYAYEHQLVVEEMLGRRLLPGEVVHHKNGKRDDNRPENLHVTSLSEHAKEHAMHPNARDDAGRFTSGVRHGELDGQLPLAEVVGAKETPRG